MKNENNFYSWIDKLADKKAQVWTKATIKTLDLSLI